jgi:hypothetical protein
MRTQSFDLEAESVIDLRMMTTIAILSKATPGQGHSLKDFAGVLTNKEL